MKREVIFLYTRAEVHLRRWAYSSISCRPSASSCAGRVFFELLVVRDRPEPTLTQLKCVIGPGDEAEPVLTIMLTEED